MKNTQKNVRKIACHFFLIAALLLPSHSPALGADWKQSFHTYFEVGKEVVREGGKYAYEELLKQSAKLNEFTQTPTCRNILYAAGATLVLTYGSIRYYNWDYAEGNFKNVGSETAPVWKPDAGRVLKATERITRLTDGGQRSLWISAGNRSYGRVFYEEDRIVYKRGDQIIASSEVVSVDGRPRSKEHPIIVPVKDSAGTLLATIHEVSTKEKDIHTVYYEVFDPHGKLIGTSDSIKENEYAVPLSGQWRATLKDSSYEPIFQIDRVTGWFADTFNTTDDKGIDPRVAVVFIGLISLEREVRSAQ